MHKDVIKTSDVKRPSGEVAIVYFSSKSNNTHRFVEKLKYKNNLYRVPIELDEKIKVDIPYVLICPTYGGGGGDKKGAVPKQVIQFLNDEYNRKHCYGVVASGNTNFNDTFCLAGTILSAKLKVPLLFQFELLGTKSDVSRLEKILDDFWVNE